jgi:hypothetical protein
MPQNINSFFAQYAPEIAGVAKVIERRSKLASVLPVKPIDTLTHKYGKETSLGGVSRRVVNQPFANVAGGVVTPAEEPIAIIGRQVKTDHRLAKASATSRGDEHTRATRAIAREMDDLLITGDQATDPTAINGLRCRCTGPQLIWAGVNGGAYSIELLEGLLDAVEDQGMGKVIVMNQNIARRHNALVRGMAGGATIADVTMPIPTYEGNRLLVIGDKVNGSPIIDFNETRGSSNQTTSVYCFAPGIDDVEFSGVKLLMASNSIEIVEEGVRDSFYIDQLEVAFGLAVYDDTAVARLGGLVKP